MNVYQGERMHLYCRCVNSPWYWSDVPGIRTFSRDQHFFLSMRTLDYETCWIVEDYCLEFLCVMLLLLLFWCKYVVAALLMWSPVPFFFLDTPLCGSALWWEHDSGHSARYRAFWPIRLITNLFKRFVIIQSQQHRLPLVSSKGVSLFIYPLRYFTLALKQWSICVRVHSRAHTRPVRKTTLVESKPIPRPVPVEFKSRPGLKQAKP